MSIAQLITDTQRLVLQHAADHKEGLVDWYPDTLKGSARTKVMTALATKGLVDRAGLDAHITNDGLLAIGRTPVAPTTPPSVPEAPVAAPDAPVLPKPEATDLQLLPPPPIAPGVLAKLESKDTKQATVITMLKRPEGATIPQICFATSWQSHTVRGFFAGALKKKLGLNIESAKPEKGERVYFIK